MSERHTAGIARRSFLVGAGAAAGALALGLWHLQRRAPAPLPVAVPASPRTAVEPILYGDHTDVWRKRWTWDSVVHSSHTRANCISTCSWNVFVKQGIAWREEQNAIYRSSEPGLVPDFNPRGCQKGAS